MDKKAKAEAKRARRNKMKQEGNVGDPAETPDVEAEASGVEAETPDESN